MRNMDISFLVRIGSSCRWWTERMPSSSMTRRPGQGFNLTALPVHLLGREDGMS